MYARGETGKQCKVTIIHFVDVRLLLFIGL